MGKKEDIKLNILIAVERLTDLACLLGTDTFGKESLDQIGTNLDSVLDKISCITLPSRKPDQQKQVGVNRS